MTIFSMQRTLQIALGAFFLSTPLAQAQTVRVVMPAPITALLPAHNPANIVSGFERQIFETLTIVRNGKLQGLLATEWEPSADQKGWIFKLRPDVKFSDGTPFNANAVVASINYLLKTTRPIPAKGTLGPLSGARAIDELTVELQTSKPASGLPQWLSHPVAAIISPKSIDDFGENLGVSPAAGTGPFVYSEAQLPDHIAMKRNDAYWGEKAQVSNLDIQQMPDDQTRLSAILSGAADIDFYLDPRDIDRVQGGSDFKVDTFRSIHLFVIHLPLKLPEFQDIKVRQALNYSIDRKAIIEQVFQGQASAADSATGPEQVGYKPVAELAYDPALAAQLFAEAGWKKDKSGILTKDGKLFPPIPLLASNNRYPGDQLLAQAAAGYLQEAGVPVQLQISEYSAFMADAQGAGIKNGWMIQFRWGFAAEAAAMICQVYSSTNPWNLSGYKSSRHDEACRAIDATFDQTKRIELVEQATADVFKDLPAIYLVSPNFAVARSSALKDVMMNSIEFHDFSKAKLAN